MRRDAGSPFEHLRLDLVHVVLEPGDDRPVPVDDGVEDRVEDGFGAAREQLRIVLQPLADDGEIG